jgi:hypothetical protein
MNIHIHIEHIVLDGIQLDAQERDELRLSMQSELSKLIANGTSDFSPARSMHVARRATSDVQCHDRSAEELGRQIAHAVYGGLGHG